MLGRPVLRDRPAPVDWDLLDQQVLRARLARLAQRGRLGPKVMLGRLVRMGRRGRLALRGFKVR